MSQPTKPLGELMREVEQLFKRQNKYCWEFILGKIYGQWQFEVVNSRRVWMGAGRPHTFSGATPEEAVQEFLSYVRDNKIIVWELQDA